MTALVIVSGIVGIVFTVCLTVLIAEGKIKLTGINNKKLGMGVSPEAWDSEQQVTIAKNDAKKEFYTTLGDRMTKARLGDDNHNLPPIDESLVKLIFGDPSGKIRAEIEGPKARGR